MTRKQLIVVGFGIYLIGLILTLPATLLDGIVNGQTQGKVRLAEASGTLWSGNAQLEFREASGLAGIAQGIQWRWRPWSLFRGRVAFDITLDQSQQQFPVSLGLSRLLVENADIRLPAAALGMAIPKLKPFGLGGNVVLKIGTLAVNAESVKGNATVEWRAATSTLSNVAPFGDYAVQFESDGNTPNVVLRTLQGPLQIEGKNTATPDGQPMFLVKITVPPEIQPQMVPLLRLVAVDQGQGVFELKVN